MDGDWGCQSLTSCLGSSRFVFHGRKSFEFGTTWGWIITEYTVFEWTTPLSIFSLWAKVQCSLYTPHTGDSVYVLSFPRIRKERQIPAACGLPCYSNVAKRYSWLTVGTKPWAENVCLRYISQLVWTIQTADLTHIVPHCLQEVNLHI